MIEGKKSHLLYVRVDEHIFVENPLWLGGLLFAIDLEQKVDQLPALLGGELVAHVAQMVKPAGIRWLRLI